MPSQSTFRTTCLLFIIACLLIIIIFQNFHRVTNINKSLNIKDLYSPSSLTPDYYKDLNWSPPPLPSIRIENSNDIERKQYGGVGDKPHLGGFTELDNQGLSDNAFNYMLGPLGIKSILDVGCGKGVSTTAFLKRGAKVLCVEGSHDAVQQSLLPSNLIIEHDFTRGPWWPAETYDAVWCVEFLEHVGRPFMLNYLPIFRKAALIFLTSSGFGGWHHVEVHPQYWWEVRMVSQGFVYSDVLTKRISFYANESKAYKYDSQHIVYGMRVFINPEVAKLKKHHHIMSGWGCFNNKIDNNDGGIECKDSLDILPSNYISLLDCNMDTQAVKKIWNCKRDERATIP